MNLKSRTFLAFFLSLLVFTFQDNQGQDVISPADLLALQSCRGIQLSPDGNQILYYISTPRSPDESPGTSQNNYWKMTLKDETASPLFIEEIKASSPRWSPDGKTIGFLYGKDKGTKQVWIHFL